MKSLHSEWFTCFFLFSGRMVVCLLLLVEDTKSAESVFDGPASVFFFFLICSAKSLPCSKGK